MEYYGFFIGKTSNYTFLLNIFPKENLSIYRNPEFWNNNEIDIENLSTPYLEVSAKDEAVASLFIGNTLNFFSNNWVELQLENNSNGHSVLFENPISSESINIKVSHIKLLRGKDSLLTDLKNTFSLNDIEEATESAIQAVFKYLHGDLLAVYNVGQGSCNAVCNIFGKPRYYFDIGGGSNGNAHTYPTNLKLCSCSIPPIILSHWHIDHWISVKKFNNFYNSTWIVPNQPMSADALKTARKLHSNGKLLVYPCTASSITITGGTLLKCNGKSQNSSGIALLCDLNNKTTLLSGDSKYNNISLTSSIDNLIVTHHGGANPTTVPNSKTNYNCHIYSYGLNNTYNHPLPNTVSLHSTKWNNRLDTINGSIGLMPFFNIFRMCFNVHAFKQCKTGHTTINQVFASP